jgi:hypothetical protein
MIKIDIKQTSTANQIKIKIAVTHRITAIL